MEWVLGTRDRHRGRAGDLVRGDQLKGECSTNELLYFKIDERGRGIAPVERATSIETRAFGVWKFKGMVKRDVFSGPGHTIIEDGAFCLRLPVGILAEGSH